MSFLKKLLIIVFAFVVSTLIVLTPLYFFVSKLNCEEITWESYWEFIRGIGFILALLNGGAFFAASMAQMSDDE